jgi:hypothetical protein
LLVPNPSPSDRLEQGRWAFGEVAESVCCVVMQVHRGRWDAAASMHARAARWLLTALHWVAEDMR